MPLISVAASLNPNRNEESINAIVVVVLMGEENLSFFQVYA